MTPFEIVLNQQRDLVQILTERTLLLEQTILSAANNIAKGDTAAAIEIILDTSEMITNEATSHTTAIS